jgi:hypothetical protein
VVSQSKARPPPFLLRVWLLPCRTWNYGKREPVPQDTTKAETEQVTTGLGKAGGRRAAVLAGSSLPNSA